MKEDKCMLAARYGRRVTLCNYNYSREGIYHPDRIMGEYDLLYLKEGEWEIMEEDECHEMKADQVLLLEPGKHHYSKKKCSPGMRNVFLHFSAFEEDGNYGIRNNTAENGSVENKEQSGFLCIRKLTDCTMRQEIYHYFQKIIETFWADNVANREFRISTLLSELLMELSDMGRQSDGTRDAVVAEILRRFRSNPERFFSPEELAGEYGMALRTMSNRFRQATGTSIHQYQMELKLNMAYELLPDNPERSLRDVAMSFGFYDEFQFSRLFKRRFGINPSVRRKAEIK